MRAARGAVEEYCDGRTSFAAGLQGYRSDAMLCSGAFQQYQVTRVRRIASSKMERQRDVADSIQLTAD